MVNSSNARDRAQQFLSDQAPLLLEKLAAQIAALNSTQASVALRNGAKITQLFAQTAQDIGLDLLPELAGRLAAIFTQLDQQAIAIDPPLIQLLTEAQECLRLPLTEYSIFGEFDPHDAAQQAKPMLLQLEARVGIQSSLPAAIEDENAAFFAELMQGEPEADSPDWETWAAGRGDDEMNASADVTAVTALGLDDIFDGLDDQRITTLFTPAEAAASGDRDGGTLPGDDNLLQQLWGDEAAAPSPRPASTPDLTAPGTAASTPDVDLANDILDALFDPAADAQPPSPSPVPPSPPAVSQAGLPEALTLGEVANDLGGTPPPPAVPRPGLGAAPPAAGNDTLSNLLAEVGGDLAALNGSVGDAADDPDTLGTIADLFADESSDRPAAAPPSDDDMLGELFGAGSPAAIVPPTPPLMPPLPPNPTDDDILGDLFGEAEFETVVDSRQTPNQTASSDAPRVPPAAAKGAIAGDPAGTDDDPDDLLLGSLFGDDDETVADSPSAAAPNTAISADETDELLLGSLFGEADLDDAGLDEAARNGQNAPVVPSTEEAAELFGGELAASATTADGDPGVGNDGAAIADDLVEAWLGELGEPSPAEPAATVPIAADQIWIDNLFVEDADQSDQSGRPAAEPAPSADVDDWLAAIAATPAADPDSNQADDREDETDLFPAASPAAADAGGSGAIADQPGSRQLESLESTSIPTDDVLLQSLFADEDDTANPPTAGRDSARLGDDDDDLPDDQLIDAAIAEVQQMRQRPQPGMPQASPPAEMDDELLAALIRADLDDANPGQAETATPANPDSTASELTLPDLDRTRATLDPRSPTPAISPLAAGLPYDLALPWQELGDRDTDPADQIRIEVMGQELDHLQQQRLSLATQLHQLQHHAQGLTDWIREHEPELSRGGDALRQTQAELSQIAQTCRDRLDAQHQSLTTLHQNLIDLQTHDVQLFLGQFSPLAQRLATAQGKAVQMTVAALPMQVDRTTLDGLHAPLLQLLSCIVTHSLEPIELRRRRGKPETGSIQVTTALRGSNLVLTVTDDGWGLDLETLRDEAIEQEWLTTAQAQGLDLPSLIEQWRPTTTRQGLDSLSRQSVVLAMVQSCVQAVQGRFTAAAQPGAGSTYVVVIPYPIVVTEVLLGRVGDRRLAFPATSIEEVVVPDPEDLREQDGHRQLRYDDEWVPVVTLTDILPQLDNLAGAATVDARPVSLGKSPCLMVTLPEATIALEISAILDQDEMVVKSQDRQARDRHGTVTLPDGTIVTVLDAIAVAEYHAQTRLALTAASS